MARFWSHFGALLELFWHLLAPFGSLWGLFGLIWSPLGSLEGTLGSLLVPIGILWECVWLPFGSFRSLREVKLTMFCDFCKSEWEFERILGVLVKLPFGLNAGPTQNHHKGAWPRSRRRRGGRRPQDMNDFVNKR